MARGAVDSPPLCSPQVDIMHSLSPSRSETPKQGMSARGWTPLCAESEPWGVARGARSGSEDAAGGCGGETARARRGAASVRRGRGDRRGGRVPYFRLPNCHRSFPVFAASGETHGGVARLFCDLSKVYIIHRSSSSRLKNCLTRLFAQTLHAAQRTPCVTDAYSACSRPAPSPQK